MKIYSIYMSHDGLAKEVYTNIKALYKGIMNTGYTPSVVTMIKTSESGYTITDLKFNYKNLCKVLRTSSRGGKFYENAGIGCEGDAYINVEEHQIVSRND